MNRNKSILFILLFLLATALKAQYIPLEYTLYEKTAALPQTLQLSMKPILLQQLDSADAYIEQLTGYKGLMPRNNFIFRKLFKENLIRYSNKDFSITADPLFHFGVGYENEQKKNTWVNSRGVTLTGNIRNNLIFNTELYETQAVLPSWPHDFTAQNAIIPGQGMAKTFKDKGFDYAYSNGYITYIPSKFVDLTLGYGKNFIGDGYRSLILSDASFNYPYFRINANFKNIKYTVLYSQFTDRNSPISSDFGYTRKWSTMHFLQFMLWKRLNIGFFDAIVWENSGEEGYRGFDFQYINPVILLRPQEFAIGSPDNALMGGNFSFKINKQFTTYGQLLLDEFKLSHMAKNDGWWANKYGIQLGVAGRNLLNVEGLFARAEYNQVRPYTYSHNSSVESYSHYSQPLAHPLGANFREGILMGSYTLNNWMFKAKYNQAMYGTDTANLDFGQNVFLPYMQHVSELGNKIGQGLKTNLTMMDMSVSYLLNRKTDMRMEAGVVLRHEFNDKWDKKMQYFYFGIHTGLRNLYYDF